MGPGVFLYIKTTTTKWLTFGIDLERCHCFDLAMCVSGDDRVRPGVVKLDMGYFQAIV